MKKLILAASTALACAAIPFVAHAATNTFPGVNNFKFTGAGGSMKVCNLYWPSDCTDSSPEVCFNSLTCAPGNLGATRAGYLVRGDISSIDPNGAAAAHWMELDLDSENYFSTNPNAHISFGAWAFLPDAASIGSGTLGTSYPNYDSFLGIPVPHAYGNGAIAGNVPCNNGSGQPQVSNYNGAAIEHYLAPFAASYAPTNRTGACVSFPVWGAGSSGTSNLFSDYTTYKVRISVERIAAGGLNCPTPSACRKVRYQIVHVAWGFVIADSTWYGGETFVDTSASDYPGHAVFGSPPAGMNASGAGWNYAANVDRASWFIANAFSRNTSAGPSWAFNVRNLNVGAGGGVPFGFFQ